MSTPNTSEQQKRARQAAFLTAYAATGIITKACEASETGRTTHYDWMQDEEYAEAFRLAGEAAADLLEEEARRRAVEGVEEPVGWYQGQPGGYVRRYSDTLLIFMLKGAKPEKYKDRHEHSGPNGQPLFKSYVGVDPEKDL